MLLVDSGNTYTKFVLCSFIDGQWKHGAIKKCKNNEVDGAWLNAHYLSASKVIFASVSGIKVQGIIKQWCIEHKKSMQIVITEKSNFGVSVVYKDESKFGVDRWLALLGAKKLYPNQACLVADLGTATTIDLLDANGVHQGGWIIPGIDLLHDCLNIGTKNISTQSEAISAITPGVNTTECVNNGTWMVTIASIEKAYNEQKKHFNDLKLIVTGGNAKKLQHLLASNAEFNEKLLFVGLSTYL